MKKRFLLLLAVALLALSTQANTVSQSRDYEVMIMARKPEGSFVPTKGDAGHAWIAVLINDGSGWRPDTTYGFWPDSNLTVNHESDVEYTKKYLRGELMSKRGQAVRKSKISESRANWIKAGAYDGAGCSQYQVVGGVGNQCNCADYATREWHVLSSKWDDFRVRALTWNLTLDSVVDSINAKNQASGDFLDNGNVWK